MTYAELEAELVLARGYSDELYDVLREARRYVECCCEDDRSDPASEVLVKIDAVLLGP